MRAGSERSYLMAKCPRVPFCAPTTSPKKVESSPENGLWMAWNPSPSERSYVSEYCGKIRRIYDYAKEERGSEIASDWPAEKGGKKSRWVQRSRISQKSKRKPIAVSQIRRFSFSVHPRGGVVAIPKRRKNPKPKALINPKWSLSLSGRSGRPKSFFQSPILFYCPGSAAVWNEVPLRGYIKKSQ